MSRLTTLSDVGPSPELIDVILVPGIAGDQGSTWGSLDSDSSGFLEFFCSRVPNTRVSTYSYPLFEKDASIFSPGGLNREANRLLVAIGQLERARRQRIVLAGHDIGGILIKQILIQAAFGDTTLRDIFHSTNVIAFIGCPHVVDYATNFSPSLNRLMSFNVELSPHPRTLYAAYLAAAVRDINAQFADIRAQLCVVEANIVSAHEDLQERVFELTETEPQLMVLAKGYHFEENLPHSELARHMNTIVRMVVTNHLADLRWEALSGLRSSATPSFSLRRYRRDQTAILHVLPVLQKELVQEWTSYGNKPFLAFRSIEDVHFTYSAVFGQMFGASERSSIFHKFDFRRSGSQKKTVGDFLCTILKETLVESSRATQSGGDFGCSLKELFRLYREVALMNQSGEEVWILLNFNESIDSSAWFLNTLYDLVTSADLRFRVIFINSSDSNLNLDSRYTTFVDQVEPEQPLSEKHSATGLQNSPETPVSTNEPVQKYVGETIEEAVGEPMSPDSVDELTQEPVREAQGVQTSKIGNDAQLIIEKAENQTLEVLRKNARVHILGQQLFKLMQRPDIADENKELITRWLVDLPGAVHPTAVQEQISKISDTRIESTFKMILSLDTLALSNSDSTLGILELVALAFQPLTYLELANLDETRKEWETEYIPQVIHPTSVFSLHPGILDLLGNEVHFRHPKLHRYLLSEDSPLSSLEVKNLPKRHNLYARLCLEYLTSPHGLNQLEAAVVSSDDVGAPQSRMNFLSYAAQFWLKHAILACSEWSPDDSVAQKFLSNTHVLDLWGRVYWHRTSSATRPSLERLGPVAILIEFAPESTLEAILKVHKDTDWMKGQYFNALLAAARVGKSDTVGLLLHQSLSPEMFDLALQAALQSEAENTITTIISEIPETYPYSVGIPTALRKALELDQKSVSERLLPRILCQDMDEDDKKSIIAAAICGNNVELINGLLERFQVSQVRDISEAVLQAVQNGHAELSNVLMERLLKVEKEERSHATPSNATLTMVNSIEDELTASHEGGNLVRSDVLDIGDGKVPVKTQEADVSTNEQEGPVVVNPEPNTEQSGPSPQTRSHYAQVVLDHAIGYGQYKILSRLAITLRNHHSSPADIGSLLEKAIRQLRPRCLSVLLKSYEDMSSQPELDRRALLDLAVSGGNVAIIQELLEGFIVLDDANFPEVFQIAMKRSPAAPEVVQFLIERGRKCVTEDIFKPELDYMEPAIENGSTDIVKLLIAEKAHLDTSLIWGGGTPLYAAAYSGCAEIVEALIKAGADINMSNNSGWSPVHAAYDNARIMKLLLDNGAVVNARTEDGETALYFATKWGYKDCVAEILQHKPQLNLLIDSTTVLSKAVDSGNLKIAELLLDAGEDPCHPETKAANALLLHRCVMEKYTDLLNRLLLYNFDLEHTDDGGRTALNCLSSAKDIPALRLLLRRGANLETQDTPWHDTPLSNSIRAGDAALASFLISKGANVNAIVGRHLDSTPLLVACRWCSSPEVLGVLVDNGADTKVVNQGTDGTIFQAVCRSSLDSRSQALSYLLENDLVDVELTSKWWGSNLATACWLTDPDVIDVLVQRGANVNAVDSVGRRPIHFALCRTLEHVKVLCNREDGNKANLFVLDHMKRNALHFAVISGRLNLVQHIIKQCKGLAKEKDCDGWTPLFWAVRNARNWGVETSERAAIIEALLNDGASIMDVGEDPLEWTPYDVARYYGLDADIIKLVTPTEKQIEQSGQRDAWVKRLAAKPRTARAYDGSFCDICLFGLTGVFFSCQECSGFAMCFKCYRSKNRNLVHDPHPFTSELENNEYEDGGDEEAASATSERQYQRSSVASEVSDDGDDGEMDEDTDESEDDEADRSYSDDSSY